MNRITSLVLRFRPDDVNSQSGFDAALAGQAGEAAQQRLEERGETEDRDVANALEFVEESPGKPRNELGQFTKVEPESPEEPEAVAPEEPASESDERDARIEALEKQLADSQSFIGQRNNELGSLREELAELRGRVEERSVQPTRSFSGDDVERLVEQHGGAGAMRRVIEAGASEDVEEEVLEAWFEEDPFEANKFMVQRAAILQRLEAEQTAPAAPTQPQADPDLEALATRERFAAAARGVRDQIGQQRWDVVKNVLPQAIDEAPESLQKMLLSNDPAQRVEGLGIIAHLAEGRVIAGATEQAKEIGRAHV